ncbi:hypothetical protein FA15DRAFT_585437 [Coprinopsis marcescibilis]|uniref:MYND-type domain-containing protein n=1 Tax=Coprinopsis marcescibilis TaxID=230819 RepID=A0A5C3L533_COPMA|nr:hypothetical protein FA15DRAFT_585437 [Coprinopsis marcescibilis]
MPLPRASESYYQTHPTQLDQKMQRGYLIICDSCGAIESPSVKFRLCGGCATTRYCSPDCQKAHWPSHKAVCQHTAAQASTATKIASVGEVDITKTLRKFTSAHSALLGWAGFQALQLKRIPSNVRRNALLLELSYRDHAEWLRRFSIVSTHIVPRTYIRDPLVVNDIQRREERCRHSGGIGTLVVILQCRDIAQVMPVEVDHPSKISWDEREDWLAVLNHFIESGRTDFKPISTTARG